MQCVGMGDGVYIGGRGGGGRLIAKKAAVFSEVVTHRCM